MILRGLRCLKVFFLRQWSTKSIPHTDLGRTRWKLFHVFGYSYFPRSLEASGFLWKGDMPTTWPTWGAVQTMFVSGSNHGAVQVSGGYDAAGIHFLKFYLGVYADYAGVICFAGVQRFLPACPQLFCKWALSEDPQHQSVEHLDVFLFTSLKILVFVRIRRFIWTLHLFCLFVSCACKVFGLDASSYKLGAHRWVGVCIPQNKDTLL